MSEERQDILYQIGQFMASAVSVVQQQLKKIIEALSLSSAVQTESSGKNLIVSVSSGPAMKVFCSVCGREHTLQAVCARCGVVLCSRCRRNVYQEGVGQIVLCPTCWANLSEDEGSI